MRATFNNLISELNLAAFVHNGHAMSVLRWTLILVPMAALVGTLCAAFLWSLDAATRLRLASPWLLYLLPVGGFVVGLLYHGMGRSVEGGNNLIVEQIHEPGGGVPLRMAPLIFFGTVMTHLFGGSAGREGTAVQLGGSLASGFGRAIRLDADGTRILLMAGIAAGFGAVFSTPIAGAVFALEVLAIGRVEYHALVPCLVASLVGDWTCLAWGIHHGVYRIDAMVPIDALLVTKAGVAGVAFGLVGLAFAEANHVLGGWLKRLVPYSPLRPVIGGVAVIALVYLVGTRDYLGLGTLAATPDSLTIASFFGPDTHPWSWALKLLFTVVTLSAGFKGGEVTPLFFIGAALGNALAPTFGVPSEIFAAIGFVALFAGAANTPLACTFMGIELFGAAYAVPIAVACFVAYICSGHNGIYLSQRVAVPKVPSNHLTPNTTLREARGHCVAVPKPLSPTPVKGSPMPGRFTVQHREIGMLRIYMKPSDHIGKRRLRTLWGAKPLYRELIRTAKADDIINAVAQHTHYGFSNHGLIRENGSEVADPHLTICVELVGAREQLDLFCRKHGDLLCDKVIVYKQLEQWTVGIRDSV